MLKKSLSFTLLSSLAFATNAEIWVPIINNGITIIIPVNESPTAKSYETVVNEYIDYCDTNTVSGNGNALSCTFPTQVVTGGEDPEGDSLTVTSVSSSSLGVVSINGHNVEFSPSPAFYSSTGEQLTYEISDPSGNKSSGTINLVVNKAPVVNGDTFEVDSPTSSCNKTLADPNEAECFYQLDPLTNDSDPENDNLSSLVMLGEDSRFTVSTKPFYGYAFRTNDSAVSSKIPASWLRNNVTLVYAAGGCYYNNTGCSERPGSSAGFEFFKYRVMDARGAVSGEALVRVITQLDNGSTATPSIPQNVRFSTSTIKQSDGVTLNWNRALNTDTYKVYVTPPGGTKYLSRDGLLQPSGDTASEVFDPTYIGDYKFSVTACNSVGCSSESDEITLTVQAAAPSIISFRYIPETVNIGDTQILRLEFGASTRCYNKESGYNYYPLDTPAGTEARIATSIVEVPRIRTEVTSSVTTMVCVNSTHNGAPAAENSAEYHVVESGATPTEPVEIVSVSQSHSTLKSGQENTIQLQFKHATHCYDEVSGSDFYNGSISSATVSKKVSNYDAGQISLTLVCKNGSTEEGNEAKHTLYYTVEALSAPKNLRIQD